MPVTVAETRAFLARKAEHHSALAARRTTALRAKLPEAAALLRAEFGADEVWSFGSLAWGKPQLVSDVDIAVSSIASGKYFRALSVLSDLFEADVDLVEFSVIDDGFAERIRAQGTRL